MTPRPARPAASSDEVATPATERATLPRASHPASSPVPSAGPTAPDDGDEHDGDAPERQIPEHTRAPAHPDCEQRVPLWEHVVDGGETLGGIAGRYGVRRADLLRLNPALTNPDLIKVGQRIRVCPTSAPRLRKTIEVTVAPGDTAGGLAQRHGLTVAELVGMQKGKLADPNKLAAGMVLTLVVDGGIAPEFLPAEPPPAERSRKSGGRRSPRASVPRGDVAMQLDVDAPRYFVKRPHLAWGTPETIRAIERAVGQYAKRHKHAPLVHIGDISKRGGGALYPHLSHRQGRDVDVGYVLLGEDGHRTRFSGVTRTNLDVPRTWSLIKAFVDTGRVEVIFMDYGLQQLLHAYAKERGVSDEELDELFQYPRGRGRSHGIIRHWRSHQHHFHVRFRS
ncbi:MAG: penicillin-insensitive murein endopeptidase [Nannocystaceae bacterium]